MMAMNYANEDLFVKLFIYFVDLFQPRIFQPPAHRASIG